MIPSTGKNKYVVTFEDRTETIELTSKDEH